LPREVDGQSVARFKWREEKKRNLINCKRLPSSDDKQFAPRRSQQPATSVPTKPAGPEAGPPAPCVCFSTRAAAATLSLC
jgi:hypothetical protein